MGSALYDQAIIQPLDGPDHPGAFAIYRGRRGNCAPERGIGNVGREGLGQTSVMDHLDASLVVSVSRDHGLSGLFVWGVSTVPGTISGWRINKHI